MSNAYGDVLRLTNDSAHRQAGAPGARYGMYRSYMPVMSALSTPS